MCVIVISMNAATKKKREIAILDKKLSKKQRKEIEEATAEIDPRRRTLASAFLDPSSPTYGNMLQSGIRAGFSPLYAKNLTQARPDWLLEIIYQHDFVAKARSNLKSDLEMGTESPVLTPYGPYRDKKTKKMMYLPDAQLIEKRQKATFLVLEKIDRIFKKSKEDEVAPVEIKNIIIIAPNGQSGSYNQTAPEAVRSIPAAS